MGTLSQQEINNALQNSPGWRRDGQFLRKEFVFPTFADVMVFVNEVAQVAEDISHYPDMDIHANTVKVSITTESSAGITSKDLEIVKKAQETEKAVFAELSK